MTKDWHETFKTWAKPPTEEEEKKGKRVADMINDAVRSSEALKLKTFEVYATGSYRNNTNVRLESDVDVAIVLKDTIYGEYPATGPTKEMLGIKDAEYQLTHFRDDVGRALVAKLGKDGVTAGDKAFDVHETSRRLDADVAVFLEHRKYTGNKKADGTWEYLSGVEMRPRSDPAKRIVNWHQQHYDEGVKRNLATKRRFKRITRILKRLRQDMIDGGNADAKAAAKSAPSFLIECLVFNAPDSCFNVQEGSYFEDVKATISSLWNTTKDDATAAKLVEVSRQKLLFAPGQPWTRGQAHDFLLGAWQHVGFKK
jgi:predicted nucleotidyltransferase/putative intracellular protease/amidase